MEYLKIKEFLRFGIVGVLATIIHYGIYLIFLNLLPDWVSYSLGYGISFLFNFILSNYYTFNTKPNIKKGIGFCFSHIINFLIHISLLEIFLSLRIPSQIAPIPVFAIAIPINFFLVRFFLKRKNN